MIHRDLHRGVPNDKVSTDDVSVDSAAHVDAITIPTRGIIFHDVVAGVDTDAEVTAEGCTLISVPEKPVPTEPVASASTRPGQSYAAAATGWDPVSYGNVVVQLVAGASVDQNTGHAVGRRRHTPHCNAGGRDEPNTRGPELPDQAGS